MDIRHLALCLFLIFCPTTTSAHWTEVNISDSDNACADIQAALNPFLIKPLREYKKHYRVKVTGTATVTFDQLHTATYLAGDKVKPNGPYRYCFGLVPSEHESEGYPVSDGSRLLGGDAKLTLWWDAAEIRYNSTGQDKPVVIYGQGDGYMSGGWRGTINGGLVEHGFLDLRMVKAANSPGFGRERIGTMTSDSLFESPTTTVGLYSHGITRAQVSGLTLRVEGTSTDQDDIGLVHIDSWGMRRTGGTHLSHLHTGMQVYGNSGMVMGQVYFPYNPGPDIVLGDPVNGGGVHYFHKCVTGQCGFKSRGHVGQLTVRDSTVEGTTKGLLLAFAGCKKCLFTGSHFEQGNATVHSILLGAGQCGMEDNYRVCGSDAECLTSNTCNVPPSFHIGRIGFSGSSVSSDGNMVEKEVWSPIYLGKGATEPDGIVFFDMSVGEDFQADSNKYYFGFDPAATVKVDFSRSVPQSLKMKLPDYDYIVGVPWHEN